MNSQSLSHWVENFCNAMMHENENYFLNATSGFVSYYMEKVYLTNYVRKLVPSLIKQVGIYFFT